LRVDDITLDRDRFDFARVLLSTSSLEIINSGARVMVDGVLFDFQIIEECGFSLGEDACLIDDKETQYDDDNNDVSVNHDDAAGCGDVNDLLNDLTKDWNMEVKNKSVRPPTLEYLVKGDALDANLTPSAPILSKCASPTLNVSGTKLVDKNMLKAVSGKIDVILPGDGGGKDGDPVNGEKRVAKRTSSCPPSRVRSTQSGSWSLEWVNNHQKHHSNTIFSPKPKNNG